MPEITRTRTETFADSEVGRLLAAWADAHAALTAAIREEALSALVDEYRGTALSATMAQDAREAVRAADLAEQAAGDAWRQAAAVQIEAAIR